MATLNNVFSFDARMSNGSNISGVQPDAGLIVDAQGNLFGTAAGGGANNNGTVFELVKGQGDTYTQTILVSFGSVNATGTIPNAGLTADAQGNLFGTTTYGGTNNAGTVYELVKNASGSYTPTTLFSFDARGNNNTGSNPYASLTADAQGDLYGTTDFGGTNDTGVVYELVKGANGSYTRTTLFSFAADTNGSGNTTGAYPIAGLIADAQGNLFGTTHYGGTNNTGTVYELVKGANGSYTQTVLLKFEAKSSGINSTGANPLAGLIADAQGNLFGTATEGGTGGTGTVYELVKNANSTYTPITLFSFADAANGGGNSGSNMTGASPYAGLTIDAQGNLFGTANAGGTNNAGVVFELAKNANGSYAATTPSSFAAYSSNGNATGSNPLAGLTADAQGNLFGTALTGGTNNTGAVFRLSNSGFQFTNNYSIAVAVAPAAGGASAAGPEGTPGTGSGVGITFTYTVTRSSTASGATDVGVALSGTATRAGQAGADYTIAGLTNYDGTTGTGLVAFGTDAFTATFTITSIPDATVEPDETVTATITSVPANAAFGASTATATITDDDAAPPPSGGGSSGPSTTPTPGPDLLTVAAGGTVAGLAGDDTITGAGSNLILGNQDQDLITAGPGPNTVLGGMGDDTITAGDGNNLLYGNEGSDSITAGDGDNTIVGGQDSTDGADVIRSGAGRDLIFGNGGDDTIAAGGGADTVMGGYGNDVILGNQGDDILLGNQGNDTLVGGRAADTLVGGMGNDVLVGGEGDDVLYGNEGLNTFVFNPGDTDFRSQIGTGDVVMDFATGTSRIDFASGPVGTATDFASAQTASTDFASIQALAQTLLTGPVSYAFVADGVDGFLFTTGGSGTAITDAVKLTGVGRAGAVKFTDIAHGALA